MTPNDCRKEARSQLETAHGQEDAQLRQANQWRALVYALLSISEELAELRYMLGETMPTAGRGT
jgi:hypothetical protein